MFRSRWPAVATVVTLLAWGTAFVAIRAALPDFSVAGLTLARLLVASLALALVTPLLPVRLPARSDLPRIAVCAATGIVGYQLLLNAGQRTVPAGTASLLVNTGPLFAALLAWLLLREQMRRDMWLGLALGLAGATTMALSHGEGLRPSADALLILGAAFFLASLSVIQKPLLARRTGFEVTCYATWSGTLLSLPLAPALVEDLGAAHARSLLAVFYLGVVASAVGYVAWAYAVARVSVATAANALYLVPLVAICTGWWVLGEKPELVALVGGALAIAGVVVSRRRPPPSAAATTTTATTQARRPRTRTPRIEEPTHA